MSTSCNFSAIYISNYRGGLRRDSQNTGSEQQFHFWESPHLSFVYEIEVHWQTIMKSQLVGTSARRKLHWVYPCKRTFSMAWTTTWKQIEQYTTQIAAWAWDKTATALNGRFTVKLMYQSNRSFNIPPGQPPGHLNFWKIFVQIPPSPGRKAVQMPHTRENYQITVLTFQ